MPKQINLKKRTLTGQTKSFLRWRDPLTGTYHKEEITDEAYVALATTQYPTKPLTYLGTQKQWQKDWKDNVAIAFSGRPMLDTLTGEPSEGDIVEWKKGDVFIFTDDWDNGVALYLKADEFTGKIPNITVTEEAKQSDEKLKSGAMKLDKGVLTVE